MRVALIGAGQRGNIYAGYMKDKMGVEIGAVVDISGEKLSIAADRYGLDDKFLFDDIDKFLNAHMELDGVIISTMDRDHYKETISCLKAGYDILLEKPISPDPAECLDILRTARKTCRRIMVCHVLRYTNFFATIKSIIDSGELGRIVTIEHTENIGNFHMAHSFVRGNWRNSNESSPIILQKSCHDMDILLWLTGSRASKISSFGDLTYFRKKNAPEGSTERCCDCPVSDNCRFDAVKAYLPVRGGWPSEVICHDQSEEGLKEALKTSPYGRCVYRCDNNVCDHQVTNILFENGVTASFHLTGLTDKMHRVIRVMCEDGEIYGDDLTEEIIVTHYSSNALYTGQSRMINVVSEEGFHGGGDYGLTRDFVSMISGGKTKALSGIEESIDSHLMAFAAEESRRGGGVVEMGSFTAGLQG
ncbi:Gfo/Idh/MocA family protein [Butyrivibrio sp. MC2013]|uniref:Gfo/Idh/MocA family protein n=1 Tax=Butyrivibrio sp. MC2013 TaxID=1280686 RepID=UPI00042096F0|nr:Gfo/Idh/MocA family oxidoreductase [Butyrivibrio sp. MC2013]